MIKAFIIAALIPSMSYAAPGCKTATKDISGDVVNLEICVKQERFAHDIYTIKLNGKKILEDIDDKITSFSINTVTGDIKGGCTPNTRMVELGGQNIPVEISRTCRTFIDAQEMNVLEFTFD